MSTTQGLADELAFKTYIVFVCFSFFLFFKIILTESTHFSEPARRIDIRTCELFQLNFEFQLNENFQQLKKILIKYSFYIYIHIYIYNTYIYENFRWLKKIHIFSLYIYMYIYIYIYKVYLTGVCIVGLQVIYCETVSGQQFIYLFLKKKKKKRKEKKNTFESSLATH